jgi:hypothetical protein
MPAKHFISGDAFRPLRDNVFVTDLESGPTLTKSGLLIPDDNMTDRGIHARWGRVWAVGPEITDISPGNWLLISHGRWTTGIEMTLEHERQTVWRIEYPDAVMLVAEEDPRNEIRVIK